MQNIRTIIFDLSEVLLHGFYGVEDFLKDDIDLPAEEIAERLQGDHFLPMLSGELTEDEFWQRILDKNDWDYDIEIFRDAIRKNMSREEIPGTREIIKSLKEQGFKLGLLSDHLALWVEFYQEHFSYHELFDVVQYSYEVDCGKWETKPFETIMEKLGAEKESTLFIDDGIANVKRAKENVGIHAIQFKDADQLREDLKQFDIVV